MLETTMETDRYTRCPDRNASLSHSLVGDNDECVIVICTNEIVKKSIFDLGNR
jgi:hypothetical protein